MTARRQHRTTLRHLRGVRAVSVLPAAALLLAACGGSSSAPAQDSPSSLSPSASSSTDRQASADKRALKIDINNNSDVDVTLKTLEIDPSDWEGGKPDQFNNVNLGVNAWKGAAVTDSEFNTISPFRLQFWKYSTTSAEPTELLADINLEVVSDPQSGVVCGLSIRGFPDMVPCNNSRGFSGTGQGFTTKAGYVVYITNYSKFKKKTSLQLKKQP